MTASSRHSASADGLLGRLALLLYRAATGAAAPLIRLYLRRRQARGKEATDRFAERFGEASLPRSPGPLAWIHAASIGEAFSVLRLIERLRSERPDLAILVTTGTVTSAVLMGQRLPSGAVHQYVPVDRLAWVRRFLDHWRPDLAVWVESEFWPNLIGETVARGIPMILVNARMSPRSFARWQRLKPVFKPLIAGFALCLAQDEAEAERLRTLGAPKVKALGNLKHAADLLPCNETELAVLDAALGPRPRWLAASTHDGEEIAAGAVHSALKARHPGLLTIIVPRHPQRGEAIVTSLRDSGLTVARRSLGETATDATDVYLADTLGELGLFYRLVTVAFVGASLVPNGGHNVLEPARLATAVLAGPHMENSQAIAEEMTAAGALRQVANAEALIPAVGHLLESEAARREMIEAALRFVAAKDDVLERVAAEIAALLPPAPPGSGIGGSGMSEERARLAGT